MKTKILIVEDNALIQAAYKKAIGTLDDMEIVGVASDGKTGLEILHKTDPDVIICDLNMPIMDGFEFTKRAMAEKPKPILIISDLVQKEDEHNVFKVLQLGAIDVLPKPKFGGDIQLIAQELHRKIKVLKGVIVFRKAAPGSTVLENSRNPVQTIVPPTQAPTKHTKSFRIVGIGASTGGPQAYQAVLQQIPKDFPLPILCVQHISPGFSESLLDWLGNSTKCKLKFGENGEVPKAGTIYFPPDDTHLLVKNGTIQLSKDSPERGHRPSVDSLFYSLALEFGDSTLAVLMTGMGDDGARGLKAIRDKGGFTISQDEKSSIVYGMPRVAQEMGASLEVQSLESIGNRILDLTKGSP